MALNFESSSSSSSGRQSGPSSSCTSLDLYSHHPATFVRVSSGDALEPAFLSAVFDKYSAGGTLGLVVERDGCASPQASPEWIDDVIVSKTGSKACYASSTYQYENHATGPIIPNPTYAQQLNAISLAGLRVVLATSGNKDDKSTTVYILEAPSFVYAPLSTTTKSSLLPSLDGSTGNIPTLADWKNLWSTWDLITLRMIPHSMLHQKPIDLRHKCLFYIGHIPTFLDMLLSKSIGGEATEPKWFWNIFERGIDPHVDDPDHCHNHSEVPEKDEDWPTLEAIIAFRNGVRERLGRLYDDLASGKRALTRNIARTLVMTHEHEGFHIETLLYMLIQRAGSGTLPPPGFTIPPWEELKQQWDAIPQPTSSSVVVEEATLTMGHDDSEADDVRLQHDVQGHTFGWDNESPKRQVQVGKFRAEWRCITNGEFEQFLLGKGKDMVSMPVSWIEEDGGFKVRTLFGPVPMSIAKHWPVLTSYDDLETYARAKGGRLPTEPELRQFLNLYDVGHEGGGNIGFRNWHPVPGTMGLEQGGRGSNGGVWEWTSTLFDTHDGFVPTQLFTGYSADFFDGVHHVSLGASYATIPRLADRKTVRNFYQHNYPYPWIGARVVYDC